MSNEKITLSIFMPFHDEEKNIRQAVETAVTVMRDIASISKYEVIIVDDGSSDSTDSIARGLVERFNGIVRLVTHEKNLGYGAAVISGIKNARYDYVFFTDGDLQFDLREISRLLQWVPEFQAVIGYRSPRVDPFYRKMNAWLWNCMVRILFGLKERDIDCAFKLFQTKLVSGFDLRSKGAMISTELLVLLKRSDVEVKEVPVTHLPRNHGKTSGAKLGVIMKAFRELFGFYFDKRGACDCLQARCPSEGERK